MFRNAARREFGSAKTRTPPSFEGGVLASASDLTPAYASIHRKSKNEHHSENREEQEEQHFRDSDRSTRNAREPEQGRDKAQHEKYQSPSQHDVFLLAETKRRRDFAVPAPNAFEQSTKLEPFCRVEAAG